MKKSDNLYEKAQKYIPGGVNSPVRAFKSVGSSPKFIKSASGAYITDVDENTYLDFVGSWGPMILGHANRHVLEEISRVMQDGLSFGAATELEVEMAELICQNIPSIEMIRMVNSGTEAVMSAIRVARGYTKKDKIIKFSGCYHGHSDSMLVKAGSGVLTAGNPDSEGVCEGVAKDTLIAKYNDISSVEELFKSNLNEIACVIIEPVSANMGVVAPKEFFLQKLRKLCDENNALLIFDEVITGFRLAFGGAQEFFSVEADLVTYGKIIGGGLPVGAYGGKREIMNVVAPLGGVYQAGTLSGNPIAMTAGLVSLKILKNQPEIYNNINNLGQFLADELRNLGMNVNHIGSLVSPFFAKNEVIDYETAKLSDTAKYSKYFNFMLSNKIYLAPSQFEAIFISNCHKKYEIQKFIDLNQDFLS